MKKIVLLLFILITSVSLAQKSNNNSLQGQKYGGTIRPTVQNEQLPLGIYKVPQINSLSSQEGFSTTTFTFSDIVVFSYFDSTEIKVYDQNSNLINSAIINSDEYEVFSPGEGVYQIEGNKTYSLIIGDPISNYVLGFYAVNENGSPLSTKLNTYMPRNYSTDHFIVFAYEDNTEYTLKNLDSDQLISAGILNEGEHYVYEGNSEFLSLTSNKPMSALSYNDQGYYYPSSNGSFCGKLFYGFSGYVGTWDNGIVVTAYENSTDILIKNTISGEEIWSGSLNEGEVYAHVITEDTYVTVESSKDITVSNTPYAGWDGSYYYLTRHIDREGYGIGNLFYVPTIPGRFDVFSYEDDNTITITNLENNEVVWTGTLASGNGYSFTSAKSRYKVESSENCSVVTSFGGSAGADFMPLNYSVFLPDLSITSADISFEPEEISTGDEISITASIHNRSSLDVSNIVVQFFDGHPDNGGIKIGSEKVIPQISSNSMANVTIDWVAPNIPEVHYIYVRIDPNQTVVESNESNNLANKPLLPNEDLLPPLSVNISAPFSLNYEDGSYSPDPFEVQATIFNNGDVQALNVVASLNQLPGGLEMDNSSDSEVQNIGNIDAGAYVNVNWKLRANGNETGILVYSMDFSADNAESKTVSRGINIQDVTAPAAPTNLRIVSVGDGEITLAWDENTEEDFFGYNLYYDSDFNGEPYNGNDANEGTSPIDVANNQSFKITGLQTDKLYFFVLRAYDTTPNESELSNEVFEIPEIRLKRMNNDDLVERFELDNHAWSFSNAGSNLWPQSWWQQFDYNSSEYPIYWNYWPIYAASQNFPDWQLFVEAFGEDYCYLNPPPGLIIYNPVAVNRWTRIKGSWGGSCFGFAISSFLFFDNYLSLSAEFPTAATVYSQSVGDENRKMINKFWIYQFGKNHLAHIRANYNKTPNETFTEIKNMIQNSERDDRILVFFHQNGSGGHAVNPYKVSSGNSIDTIFVYDNNAPMVDRRIHVNRTNNTWDYPEMTNWGGSRGLFLMDPVSTYTTKPVPTNKLPEKDKYISTSNSADYLEVYNSFNSDINIKSSLGDSIVFNSSQLNVESTIESGVPIIPINGGIHPPIGYSLPNDNYNIKMSNSADSISSISIFSGNMSYSVDSKNTEEADIENINYNMNDQKLKLFNENNREKIYQVSNILSSEGFEKVVSLNELELSSNDSIKVSSDNDGSFKIENFGNDKTYDIHFKSASDSSESDFEHLNITLGQNSSHKIMPNWDDLSEDDATIYVDENNDGTTDDSVTIDNQFTDVDRSENVVPDKYKLYQNYPNPFNPTTTITYSIPKTEKVSLKVFDVLGNEITTLVNEVKSSGIHKVVFNAGNLSSGVYFYRIQAGSFSKTLKIVLLR